MIFKSLEAFINQYGLWGGRKMGNYEPWCTFSCLVAHVQNTKIWPTRSICSGCFEIVFVLGRTHCKTFLNPEGKKERHKRKMQRWIQALRLLSGKSLAVIYYNEMHGISFLELAFPLRSCIWRIPPLHRLLPHADLFTLWKKMPKA